jgi:hypothetical protein
VHNPGQALLNGRLGKDLRADWPEIFQPRIQGGRRAGQTEGGGRQVRRADQRRDSLLMAGVTYDTLAEAEADREQQRSLLTALNGWDRALRRDACGAWAPDLDRWIRPIGDSRAAIAALASN